MGYPSQDFTFNEYERAVHPLAVYPNIGNNLVYPTLGLCGEAGEIAEKMKKVFRDFNGEITEDKRKELIKEVGDVLWYVMALSKELGSSLEEVATVNRDKLLDRKNRNKIHGSGDNR